MPMSGTAEQIRAGYVNVMGTNLSETFQELSRQAQVAGVFGGQASAEAAVRSQPSTQETHGQNTGSITGEEQRTRTS